jgi:hypothetical protein
VSDLLDLVRRIDFAMTDHLDRLERDGPALWEALRDGDGDGDVPDMLLVGLLGAMAEIDRLGDALATWAVDRADDRPNAAVDAVIADVTDRLRELGVPHQTAPGPPPRGRGERRRRGSTP